MGIAKRTDRIMAKSRDFAIPLDSQTEAELTAFFRLLDKAVYSGYIGTPEEIDGAEKTDHGSHADSMDYLLDCGFD